MGTFTLNYLHAKSYWVLLSTSTIDRIYVPDIDNLQIRLLVIAHSGLAGHIGMSPMKITLKKRFYWPKMNEHIETFVNSCLHCSIAIGGRTVARPLGTLLRVTTPWEMLLFDIVHIYSDTHKHMSDGEKNSSLLVLKDDFSHFVWLYALCKYDALTIATILWEHRSIFKYYTYFTSDQGTHFVNHVVQELTTLLRIEHRFTPVYHPKANAVIERTNRTIRKAIKSLTSEAHLQSHQWHLILPMVQKRLNHTVSGALGNLSSFQVLFGWEPDVPLDNILLEQPDIKKQSNFAKVNPNFLLNI